MEPSHAREVHRIREEYQKRLNETEQRVREEVEAGFRNKSGPVYKTLKTEIEATLLKEERIRTETLDSERTTQKRVLDAEYAAKGEGSHVGVSPFDTIGHGHARIARL